MHRPLPRAFRRAARRNANRVPEADRLSSQLRDLGGQPLGVRRLRPLPRPEGMDQPDLLRVRDRAKGAGLDGQPVPPGFHGMRASRQDPQLIRGSAVPQDPLTVTYDAVVVGSGATGGWAAKKLSEAGLRVAIVEAGRNISADEFTEHMPAYKLEYRNLSPEIVRTRP